MAMIGLVTVLYNSDDVLEGFLKSISFQKYTDYILYLIDNSANKKTDQLLTNLFDHYKVSSYKHINTGGNIGVAAGNNWGIKESLADGCTGVILLNNDIEIEQDYFLSNLLSVATSLNEKIVVPKILYYDTRKIWTAGGYMDNWRALGVHYNENNEHKEKLDISKHITYAPSCFMFIKKEVFDSIGFMDESYFAYCDDTDFVYRACKKGFKLYYESSLTVLHKVSSSSGGDNSLFYIYYSNRNKIYFIKKNYKGFRKYFSLFYTLLSRTFFYLKFDKVRKARLLKALQDGFRMPIRHELK